jgi:hypothetical protein
MLFGFFKWMFTVLAILAFARVLKVGFTGADRPWLDYGQDLFSAMIAFSLMVGVAAAMWLTS